ncbi:GAF and ANTAR domain-containing protein [Pseudonocardia spinosispora]|uniref:GAF and ANTAR domain-containing protein n=1 Tax=Pseudonocardia spinosispora TaxID=103441 RepID=UPI000420E573|nr:GAF and ANTAR domain-containing protein [Pseudonocardia spinosispora]
MPAQPTPPSPATASARPEPRHIRAGLTELVLDVARTPATECDTAVLLRQICIELTELCGLVGCGALILDSSTGVVREVAGSHPEAEQLTRLVHQLGEDAGLTALRSGRPAAAVDLTEARTVLAEAAGRVGLPVTAAVGLRAVGELVGCLQLFGADLESLSDELLRELRPLADVLGAALHDAEAYRYSATMVSQLSAALDSQRPIEQAKGLLAERHHIDLDAAYRMLRDQARRRESSVAAVAIEVVGLSWKNTEHRASENGHGELPEPGTAELPEQRALPTDREKTP